MFRNIVDSISENTDFLENKINDLIKKLGQNGISCPEGFSPSYFMNWYSKENHKNLKFAEQNDLSPIEGSKLITQRISADFFREREAHILSQISNGFKDHDKLMVVCGANHLILSQRAIMDVLPHRKVLIENTNGQSIGRG